MLRSKFDRKKLGAVKFQPKKNYGKKLTNRKIISPIEHQREMKVRDQILTGSILFRLKLTVIFEFRSDSDRRLMTSVEVGPEINVSGSIRPEMTKCGQSANIPLGGSFARLTLYQLKKFK